MHKKNTLKWCWAIAFLLAGSADASGGWDHEQRENPITGERIERVTGPWVPAETLEGPVAQRLSARLVITCGVERGVNARLVFSEPLPIKPTEVGYKGLHLETDIRWDDVVLREDFVLERAADGAQTYMHLSFYSVSSLISLFRNTLG